MQRKVREIEGEQERLQGDFMSNETAFKESRNYMTQVQDQLRKANMDNETLKQENFRL